MGGPRHSYQANVMLIQHVYPSPDQAHLRDIGTIFRLHRTATVVFWCWEKRGQCVYLGITPLTLLSTCLITQLVLYDSSTPAANCVPKLTQE